MDYWERVERHHHVDYTDFRAAIGDAPVWMLTTRGSRSLWDAGFSDGDVLLFGPESRGLPAELLASDPSRCLRIPIVASARSLNLGTSVGIALYEALRQTGWSAR
jgi:tRNA (cytidine/uridine-2'-O-)-methyltransferase